MKTYAKGANTLLDLIELHLPVVSQKKFKISVRSLLYFGVEVL